MCTSNRSQACLLSRAMSKRTLHPGGTMCWFLSHTLMTRPAACTSRRRGAGRSRRTSSSSGSSARRAGLEEARLMNLARQSQDGCEESLVCARKCVGSRLVVDLCSFALCVCFFFLGMQWRFLYTRFFRARCNELCLYLSLCSFFCRLYDG